MTRVIAISNRKGGTGKTTTAVNLSSAFAIFYRSKVLLVDVDSQANATISLGIIPNSPDRSVFGVLNGRTKLRGAIVGTEVPNLYLLPSYVNLSKVEPVLFFKKDGEYLLKKFLEEVINEFEFVIIDCPPNIGMMGLSALIAANEVIIPIRYDFLSMEGANQMFNTLHKIIERKNKNLKIDGVLITHFDESINKNVSDYFGSVSVRRFSTIIRFDPSLAEAPKYGKPIFLYSPEGKGAQDYLSLAKEVYSLTYSV
jgi:chromosome partitioning protein